MNILAIETSSDVCSVALECNGQRFSRNITEFKTHAQNLLPLIEQVLHESNTYSKSFHLQNLDAIAFGQGPGSFTGLRIAASAVQGLALPSKIPVIALSSMRILAQTAYRAYGMKAVAICIDARMNEVYFARYALNDHLLMQLIGRESLIPVQQLSRTNPNILNFSCVGGGWALSKKAVAENIIQIYPDSFDALDLAKDEWLKGNVISAAEVQPEYLRNIEYRKQTYGH